MIHHRARTGEIFALVVLVLSIAAAGCLTQSYGSGDNGATVHAKPGEEVTITLGENPSTGFVWNATTSGDLSITWREYASGNPVGDLTGMVGSGGSRSFRLLIGKEPVQTFSAELRRPGEPANRTMNQYTLRFVVP